MSEDITALNIHCLMVMRDMALRDMSTACLKFGLTRDLMQKLCDIPFESIATFAECDALYFRPNISTRAVDQLMIMPSCLRAPFVEVQSATLK